MNDTLDLEKRPASPLKYLLIGCVGVLVVALVLSVIGGLYVANNWRGWASTAVTAAMTEGINDSELTNEDKAALIARVQTVGDEFEAERLTLEDMQAIGEKLLASPIIPVAAVDGIQRTYIAPSGLTDDEKARARRLNQRLAKGLFDKRITGEDINEVIQPLAKEDNGSAVRITTNGEGTITNFQLSIKDPAQTTDEDLRAFMANAESLLEQKAIADEPFEVDFVAEFDRAIEQAIGRPLPTTDRALDPAPDPQ